TPQQRKQAEGKIILDSIQPSDFLMLLDERGKQFTSIAFAEMLQKRMASGLKRLVFLVGGPYGFSQEVYDRADAKISLSTMTFSHEMVRLFFAEQIYRAMTILRGEPYHHE
ncbi:MAG: 23S rRNA (pseudouridine(1915)-N(3))-methyltransferase RlmH, partial [Muribaculaceae bacterium]|nr:23S rRNA (pseudouridine(1915)-N(3))-methyltransferase RlmH [Muribaculaceae bacterium]